MSEVIRGLFEPITMLRVMGYSKADIGIDKNILDLCKRHNIPENSFYATLDYYMEEIDDPKSQDVMRLEKAIQEVMLIMQEDSKATKLAAIKTLTSLLDRHARLLGLDSPVKVNNFNQEIRYSIEGVDPMEIFNVQSP